MMNALYLTKISMRYFTIVQMKIVQYQFLTKGNTFYFYYCFTLNSKMK